MKVYDKEIYTKQESIKTTAIIILVFLIGFVAGYLANTFNNSYTPKNEVKEPIIPSVSETIYVDTSINNLITSSDYSKMSLEEKQIAVTKLLNTLKKEGEIKSYNYSESNTMFSFTYKNGTLGGVTLEDLNLASDVN